mmetsp:Transcript_24248/g.47037  ORF Transcript_24248/g.47037 Transcript_24248/m.47037 type:complete len:350 (-) Transcript_24248:139-1188(-)
MARTSGRASRLCCLASRPSSARLGGMSGSTPPSKRPSGLARRTRSCCILPRSCQRSGAPSRPSWGGRQPSASTATRSFWTRPCAQRAAPQTRPMTRESCGPARSIRTPRRSLPGRTLWIWMRTRRRCCQRRGRAWPTPRARRPSARPARSSWRRPSGWRRCRRGGSSRQQASTWPRSRRRRSMASTTRQRSPSTTRPRWASTRRTRSRASWRRRSCSTWAWTSWRGSGATTSWRSRATLTPRRIESARRRTSPSTSSSTTGATTPSASSSASAWCCRPRRCRTGSWRTLPKWVRCRICRMMEGRVLRRRCLGARRPGGRRRRRRSGWRGRRCGRRRSWTRCGRWRPSPT